MRSNTTAQGRVFIRCRRSIDEGPDAHVVTGHGLSTNIIEASVEAYLAALEKLLGSDSGVEADAASGTAR